MSQHNCSALATCSNEHGIFSCDCLEGFSGNGFDCEGKYSQDFRDVSLQISMSALLVFIIVLRLPNASTLLALFVALV